MNSSGLPENRYSTIIPLILIVMTAVFFWREFAKLSWAWVYDPYIRYGILIPVISGYLIWAEREHLPLDFRNIGLGVVLVICSFPILLLERNYGTINHAVIAFLPFVFGVVLASYSVSGIRRIWFPLAYLGFMFPLPRILTTNLALLMSKATYQLTIFWLNLGGIRHSSTYDGLPTICVYNEAVPVSFSLDVACVSVFSLLGFIAFGIFFGYVLKGPLYKRLSVIAAGCLILVILNSVRLALIFLIASMYGSGLATEVFHIFGGWVLIFVSFILVIILSRKSLLDISTKPS